MSFWDLSDGGNAKDTGTEYEVPGGNMDPIPNNSDVLAEIVDIKWQSKKDTKERYVEAQWSVLQPEGYANRRVFHKLWVDDLDPNAKTQEKAIQKRDKARRMLAAMDANAGGRLMQSAGVPTDNDLALALCKRPMVIKVMLWEMKDSQTGGMIQGNWVSAVKAKDTPLHIGEAKPAPAKAAQSGGGGGFMDDEIPF